MKRFITLRQKQFLTVHTTCEGTNIELNESKTPSEILDQ